MRIAFPSEQFPPPPAFTLDVPDDWTAVPTADLLLAVVGDAPSGAFRSNVVVTSRRHASRPELGGLAEGVRRRLEELPEALVIGEKTVSVDSSAGSLPAHLARVSYRHPEAGTLVQAVLTVPVGGDDVVDVLELVGTAAGDGRLTEEFAAVDHVLHSIRITRS